MNADEVIKALRNDSHFGCPVWHEKCTQLNESAADIIESLQAQLAWLRNEYAEYRTAHDQYVLEVDKRISKICGEAARYQINILSLSKQLTASQRRERAAVEWIQAFTESIDQPCLACKYNTDSPVCSQICGGCGPMGSDSCKWEWRGDAEEGEKL